MWYASFLYGGRLRLLVLLEVAARPGVGVLVVLLAADEVNAHVGGAHDAVVGHDLLLGAAGGDAAALGVLGAAVADAHRLEGDAVVWVAAQVRRRLAVVHAAAWRPAKRRLAVVLVGPRAVPEAGAPKQVR